MQQNMGASLREMTTCAASSLDLVACAQGPKSWGVTKVIVNPTSNDFFDLDLAITSENAPRREVIATLAKLNRVGVSGRRPWAIMVLYLGQKKASS